ncbi:MAG: hypothetical protein IKE03_10080 [Blautia sp.]|nr:hypothetical protein [Blautia sp.]
MRQRINHSMVTTGIPSIFLVFSVFCLVILSLLSVGSARTDLQTSLNSLSQAGAYYDAGTCASAQVRDAALYLRNLLAATEDESVYFLQAEQYFVSLPQAISEKGPDQSAAALYHATNTMWDPTDRTATLEIPYTDKLTLVVTLQVLFAASPEDPCLTLTDWYTRPDRSWEPQPQHNLFQAGDEGIQVYGGE